jgi:cbb3-type cytochrome oxidase subunit 3
MSFPGMPVMINCLGVLRHLLLLLAVTWWMYRYVFIDARRQHAWLSA